MAVNWSLADVSLATVVALLSQPMMDILTCQQPSWMN
jgi:hypothetical protein